MSKLIHSERLETILKTRQDSATWEADSNCTSGYDNDGSTGFEIFDNGVGLALQAAEAGKDIFFAETDSNHVFVIASSEEEACERAMAWEEDAKEEEDSEEEEASTDP